jgi:WhiB family redox-sensing transcriptional regulator
MRTIPRGTQPETYTNSWEHQAACRSVNDPELFFPINYTSPTGLLQIEEAKAICSTCPVEACCLNDILSVEKRASVDSRHGIRGGMTPEERFQLAGRPRKNHHRRAAA